MNPHHPFTGFQKQSYQNLKKNEIFQKSSYFPTNFERYLKTVKCLDISQCLFKSQCTFLLWQREFYNADLQYLTFRSLILITNSSYFLPVLFSVWLKFKPSASNLTNMKSFKSLVAVVVKENFPWFHWERWQWIVRSCCGIMNFLARADFETLRLI